MIYIVVTLTVLALFIVARKYRKLALVALIMAFVIMWLVAGLRSESVGLDTKAYAAYFYNVVDGAIDVWNGFSIWSIFLPSGNDFENGYKIYNYVFSLLSGDFTVFLLVTYAFIYFSFYNFIKKYSPKFGLSSVVFVSLFFFSSMNYLRQSIAAAILTWGVRYIFERKLAKYLIIVALATLVHQASIVMILPYMIYGKKFTKRSALIYMIIGIVAFASVNVIVQLIASSYGGRLDIYGDALSTFKVGSFIVFAAYMTVLIIAFFALSLRGDKLSNESKKLVDFYLHMLVISVLIAFIAIKSNAFARLVDYFMIFSIISLPYFFSIVKSTRKAASLELIFIIFIIVYSLGVIMLRPDLIGVWPYEFAIVRGLYG